MSLWDSLTVPLLGNDAWIEMSQTIQGGLSRVGSNVASAVRSTATRLGNEISETEAFQNALSLSREALGTASTSYLEAGAQEISNVAARAADTVTQTMERAQGMVADAAMAYVEAFE